MKALMLHANQWLVRVESPSDRIGGCEPEVLREATEHMEECLVVLFHIEKGDSERQTESLCRDIRLLAESVGTTRLMVSGFAHLSHSRPDPETAKKLFLQVVATCKTWQGYEVRSSHFGWNKSLLLDIKGHPRAFNFRSYEEKILLPSVPEERRPRSSRYSF